MILPSQQQVARLFLSDLAQQESGNDGGHKSDAHLGVAELRFGNSQREVAQQSQSGAAGDGSSIHRSDRDFWKLVKRSEQADHRLRIFQVVFWRAADQRFQVVQVHAGRESFARSGHNEYARVGRLDFLQRAQQIVNQLEADGVALVRTIQRDRSHARIVCELDRFVVHLESFVSI